VELEAKEPQKSSGDSYEWGGEKKLEKEKKGECLNHSSVKNVPVHTLTLRQGKGEWYPGVF